jgi:sugar transferase (PEP-CTERM/EpsH1 system associated)
VLFLTHRLPYAPNRGDRIRANQIVRLLASQVELDLVSLVHDRNELDQAESIRRLGVQVLPCPVPRLRNHLQAFVGLTGRRPVTHMLLNAPGVMSSITTLVSRRRPDVVLAYCSSMAQFALQPPLSRIPLVVDLVDVDSEKWSALAAGASWPKRWLYARESRYLARFEREAAARAHAMLVVNEREGEVVQRIAPRASVHIVPVGIDLANIAPHSPPTERPHIVFCGVMNYSPNVDGVLWFVREIWPIIRAARADARFTIVGSDPVAAIRRLATAGNGIEVTGTVSDVRSYLWRAAVAVAPLLVARGVQTKVLEGVAAGLPVVLTSQAQAGLPQQIHAACRVADSRQAFADETIALLSLSGAERRAIAACADMRGLDWQTRLAPLPAILASAAAAGALEPPIPIELGASFSYSSYAR